MKKTDNTVYLVDDDKHVRDSLQWLLSSINLNSLSFKNGLEFLNYYNGSCRGCLITDVRMPIMGGLELAEQLKIRRSSLPIIMITGYGDIPMAVRAMKLGVVDFLTKPFNEQYLIDLIHRLYRENAPVEQFLP